MRFLQLSTSILVAMSMTSCVAFKNDSPKFGVGDCIQTRGENTVERWEKKKRVTYIHKIVEIGRTKYRVLTLPPDRDVVYYSDSDYYYDRIMEKVDCPSELGVFYDDYK